MALSSDQLIKQEIIDVLGSSIGDLKLRIFPESSNFDQVLFHRGGLTFEYDNVQYGSCDAAWFIDNKPYFDQQGQILCNQFPIVALEGTDALNRGSSGNAQYQRFHHVLGAMKNGLIGIYYLRSGNEDIRPDLFYMAWQASKSESGFYLIIDNLHTLKTLLNIIQSYGKDSIQCKHFLEEQLNAMYKIWDNYFDTHYNRDWTIFAKKRSTIIKDGYVVKYAGRMRRNFTDSSQRAGHIAVGEMYLTKYFFPTYKTIYLLPKMTHEDIAYLDKTKQHDKEWCLLRHEPNVSIATIDDVIGLPTTLKEALLNIKDVPLKGDALKIFNESMQTIITGIENDSIKIDFDSLL